MALSQNNTGGPTYYGLSTDAKPLQSVPDGAIFIETDSNKRFVWTGGVDGNNTDWIEVYMPVSLGLPLAGERNTDSASNGYQVVRKECNLSVISKTTAVTIGGGVAGDTHLIGLMFTTALTGTCVVAGFADSDGTAQSITFPIGTVGFRDFYGAINAAGALTVTCSTAGDDNFCCVLWRPV